MGLEARCVARWGDRESGGSAHLETDHVAFRGDFRVRIAFAELRSVEAVAGRLVLTTGRGTLALDLGPRAAATWAGKIRTPKPLLDKVGVAPGARVAVLGVKDDRFMAELSARTTDVSRRPRKDCDVLFYEAGSQRDLARLERLRGSIKPNGAIWVVSPRGDPGIQDVHVIAAAKNVGLVDSKVVRFSDTHTALKLVIPLARR